MTTSRDSRMFLTSAASAYPGSLPEQASLPSAGQREVVECGYIIVLICRCYVSSPVLPLVPSCNAGGRRAGGAERRLAGTPQLL